MEDATPEPFWIESPDPNLGLNGIKFQPGGGFSSGDGIDRDCDGSDLICTGDATDTAACENLAIPDGALPPAGQCKAWDPALEAGQQGAPGNCDCENLPPGTCLIDENGNVVDCGN